MLSIDPSNLKFRGYDPLADDLTNLDFTQTDGSDPLLVQEYVKNHLLNEIENRSIKAYVVTHEDNAIAFFTLSMSVMCGKSFLADYDDAEDGKLKSFVFPALLMGKIGIDKKYRCFGIGKYICLFCMGLAQKTNEKMACSLFVFRTTKSLAEKIYGPKYCFRWKDTTEKMVWAYRKVL